MAKPGVDGSVGQVLSVTDASGNYTWQKPSGIQNVSLEYDADNQALYIRVLPF